GADAEEFHVKFLPDSIIHRARRNSRDQTWSRSSVSGRSFGRFPGAGLLPANAKFSLRDGERFAVVFGAEVEQEGDGFFGPLIGRGVRAGVGAEAALQH